MSAVGVIFDRKEVSGKIDEADKEKTGFMSFNQIWDAFSALKEITNEEIIDAFKAFDKGGKIRKEELKYVMTSLGDKIKEEEADKILSNFNIDAEGNIDYKAFLQKYEIEA